MPLLVKRPPYVSHMQHTCVTFHAELQGRTLNSNFALSQHCCQLCYGIWLKAACAFKELCAASCFRNSSTLPMSSSFWPPGVAFSTVGVLRRTRPLHALRIRSGSGSDAKWLSILLHIISYNILYILLKHTHIAIRVKWCKMLLGDTWWRELPSHTRSFPLACWTSLSSFYWLFWCLAFIICLLYRIWAKKWQGAYEGHVANLHLLIEIRHEGNINKSHISLFRGTVLTKQKQKNLQTIVAAGTDH